MKPMIFPRWLLIAVLVIGALFSFFGFFFLAAIPLPMLRNYLAASHWTETPAVVKSSSVENKDRLAPGLSAPKIVYTYTFDGAIYTCGRYNASDLYTPDYHRHHDTVKAYPPGRAILCYVNPEAPGTAVIDRAMPPEFTPALLAGLGVLAFGLALVLVPFSTLRRQRREANLN